MIALFHVQHRSYAEIAETLDERAGRIERILDDRLAVVATTRTFGA